jgi:hypothetical protein
MTVFVFNGSYRSISGSISSIGIKFDLVFDLIFDFGSVSVTTSIKTIL